MAPAMVAALAAAAQGRTRGFSAALRTRDDQTGDFSALWVDGEGRAEWSLTSRPMGEPGPVGRFCGQVEPALVRELAAALGAVDYESLVPRSLPGQRVSRVEVTTGSGGRTFAMDALLGDQAAFQRLSAAFRALMHGLADRPAAALALRLERRGARWAARFEHLGPEPLLLENPAWRAPEGDEARGAYLAMDVSVQIDPVHYEWQSEPVPLAGSAFEKAGRFLLLPPQGAEIEFDAPFGGAAASAPAVRLRYGSRGRPPGLRLGGIDVCGGRVASEAVEPAGGAR